ncbi:peptide/nickel transport system ATP-binding protein [Thermocatellispora tengchongensis]|uniref:Peptide/nickel transport system ATP-binding protein n=1 Tax=Thermocatellispora tengchongensis TaxID=1073253 RepID=A0A840PKY7_9ACTN|nr:ABC transporter ATP-binding protein [Thermocatellispora tengchongensis]MBB5136715.1 peptide/nickel transport system ATP-binding protein [Thermocatellispora tengchongensis]
MSPLLTVTDLCVRAGDKTLVRDVGFALEAGQSLGIVGESGSGKTMTARAVLAALPAGVTASGEIVFDGIPMVGRRERDLRPLRGTRVSMVMQDPFTALNPLQTIGEHIRESLPRRVRRDRATARSEVARRLAEVGLDSAEVAGRYPFQLSGGMRQRVAIAAALAADPDLLIADEPTTALDASTQAEILRLLHKLQRDRGMALVLITHDLRVAFSVCDRVLVMYAGSVVEDAPSAALMEVPEHPYTLGLLMAEPPVTHVVETLTAIPGSVPRADDVATRCAFAARCDWHVPQCAASRPPLAPVGPGHLSACTRLDEIRPGLRQRRERAAAPATATPPPAGTPILTVSGLSMTYRTTSMVSRATAKQAVRDVSFEIAEGESLGLIGETGSGKTTIARCILGLQTATGGTIRLGDLDVSDHRRLSAKERRRAARLVQVVFQDPYSSLNPMLTIGAALEEAIAVGGTGQSAGELLEMIGLPASYAGRRPSALSGGQRQRVAIARALAVRPRLLICDEPVAALDVSVQAQILELLRQIRRAHGTSMLFITHDLSVVRQMTDRAIVLRHGEIVESGDTAQVLDNPRHPYTVSLVESVPGHQ